MLVQRTDGSAVFYFLVAIEADPDRARGPSRGRPACLGRGDAEQMLAHLAADLRTTLSQAGKCDLAAAGALYDQCQILRPGLPALAALAERVKRLPSEGAQPTLTAIGADEGVMPADALQPDRAIPPALLHLLPMVAAGPEALMEDLAEEMEHRFLAEGQVSAHTANWLEAAFGIGIAHARFMTLTDLNAMFRMQLEHLGYLPLWEIVDAAVLQDPLELTVVTGKDTRYRWDGDRAWVTFQTFDYWANEGAGRAIASDAAELAEAYAEWTRELRRYCSTLAAHFVPLSVELPEGSEARIEEQLLFEEVSAPPPGRTLASITEHSHHELGVVAVTALRPETARHYYPLTPGGLNDIHESIQALELSGEGMAFSGQIEIDPVQRRLQPAVFEE